jgi:hypothetical protein
MTYKDRDKIFYRENDQIISGEIMHGAIKGDLRALPSKMHDYDGYSYFVWSQFGEDKVRDDQIIGLESDINLVIPESIILVWDRNGKFFQWWTDIDHGKMIAENIGGTYKITKGDPFIRVDNSSEVK